MASISSGGSADRSKGDGNALSPACRRHEIGSPSFLQARDRLAIESLSENAAPIPFTWSRSVIGRPDAERGETVIAVVVPHAGQEVNESELDVLCLGSIARFKRPKAYVFAEELPKNSYGKVPKR